jgi:hypothetical protein
MKTDLAPCPFCYSQKTIIAVHDDGCQVNCTSCLAAGPNKTNREDAMDAWCELYEELTKARQWYANEFAIKLGQIQKSMKPLEVVRGATGR